MATLYQDLTAAGIETAHHESDLYVPDTPEAREILRRHEAHWNAAQRFRSEIDGRMYLDVPFAYDPFWKNRKG